MFLEVLRKEMLLRRSSEGSKAAKVGFFLARVAFMALFLAVLVLIVLGLDTKIQAYSPYGSFDFLVLLLFILFLVGTIYLALGARKTLFDAGDESIVLPLPIPSSTLVAAKLVYLAFSSVLFGLLTATPVLICYGATRGFVPQYYVFSLFYPVLMSLASVGLGTLLSVALEYLLRLIRKSLVAEIVLSSLLVIGLCYLYSFVLQMFWNSLGDASVGGMFPASFLEGLHQARIAFLPVYSLLDAVLEKSNLLSDIFLFLGVSFTLLTAGIIVASLLLGKAQIGKLNAKKPATGKSDGKVLSTRKALLKKEALLLFVDESNLFSYTALLIAYPFLCLSVVSTLQNVFAENLTFYAAYFPNLFPGIALLMVLLFGGAINVTASGALSREKRNLVLLKTAPLPFKDIFLSKALVPFVCSEASLLATCLSLLFAKAIAAPVFFSALFLGSLLFVFTLLYGLYADMKKASPRLKKFPHGALNAALSFLVPALVFAAFFLLDVFARLPSYALYLVVNFVPLLILGPLGFLLYRSLPKAFREMEVSAT